MAARKPPVYRYKVRIRVREAGRGFGDMPGFLDMLRYDAATVETWDRTQDGFEVTLRSERVTPARWGSFGLHIAGQERVA